MIRPTGPLDVSDTALSFVRLRQVVSKGSTMSAAMGELSQVVALVGYVGPGSGITLIAALIGVLAAVGSALLFVILWPLRMLRRKMKQAKQTDDESAGAGVESSDAAGSEASADMPDDRSRHAPETH
jgi:hypothetical protein